MTLSTKNFDTLVSDQVAAVQGAATALIDFTDGGPLRAMIEANAGLGIWLESLVLQVYALCRASTSSGSDLDSFVGDFGFERQGAVAAVTTATFARFTATAQAVVQPGVNIGTLDGSQTFTVTKNVSNPAWSNSLNGYVIPSGTTSLAGVPVQATLPGAAGNVVAGAIGLILTAVSGVDTVTNVAPATGGADAETDTALRLGFQAFILTLASATLAAISNAIENVQAGLANNIAENVNSDSSPRPGFLSITVDDGTGSPPSSLLSSVYSAVDAVRAAGIGFAVSPPTTVTAIVVMTITAAAGYSGPTLASAVSSAISSFIAGLTLGTSLPYNRLSQVAFDTSPGVANVTAYTLNGSTADIDVTAAQKIVVGSVTVGHT